MENNASEEVVRTSVSLTYRELRILDMFAKQNGLNRSAALRVLLNMVAKYVGANK